MKIFLDDERNYTDFIGYDENWTVARDFEEFKHLVLESFHNLNDLECISFDHDLGKDSPDGYECSKWLVDQYIIVNEVWIHTMNPVGRDNIFHLMKNWQKYNNLSVNIKHMYLKLK